MNTTKQFYHIELLVMLYKVILTFGMKSLSSESEHWSESYWGVLSFWCCLLRCTVLQRVVPQGESRQNPEEWSSLAVLPYVAVYYAVQGDYYYFWGCGWAFLVVMFIMLYEVDKPFSLLMESVRVTKLLWERNFYFWAHQFPERGSRIVFESWFRNKTTPVYDKACSKR